MLILAYEFKKIENASCSPKGTAFKTLDEAESECKKSKPCKGILDVDCNDQKDYYICLKNATVVLDNKNGSCFHEKYIVGRQLTK